MDDVNYAGMEPGEMLAAVGDDAHKWATAFCQIKEAQGWTADFIDFGLMVGWFANAIEQSHAVRSRRRVG